MGHYTGINICLGNVYINPFYSGVPLFHPGFRLLDRKTLPLNLCLIVFLSVSLSSGALLFRPWCRHTGLRFLAGLDGLRPSPSFEGGGSGGLPRVGTRVELKPEDQTFR